MISNSKSEHLLNFLYRQHFMSLKEFPAMQREEGGGSLKFKSLMVLHKSRRKGFHIAGILSSLIFFSHLKTSEVLTSEGNLIDFPSLLGLLQKNS